MKRAPASRQRGAALLTAMIIVVIVATLSVSMVWSQWKSIQIEESERSRTQSGLILTGALDWARLILREDAINGGTDNLNEPWAVPLAEARLSTFLAADRNNTDGGPEAFLSGQITDAQSRFNLVNITEGDSGQDQLMLRRLFETLGLSNEIANRLINNFLAARANAGGSNSSSNAATRPIMPSSIQNLRWFGLDAETIKRLEPYVIIIPNVRAPVNLNTAPREVIAAVLGIDVATAERLVQARQQNPFKNLTDVKSVVGDNPTLPDQVYIDVKSSYFEVRGRLRLADRILEERSLVQRVSRTIVIPIQRERVSSEDTGITNR